MSERIEALKALCDSKTFLLNQAKKEIDILKKQLDKCKRQRDEWVNVAYDDLGKVIHEIAPKLNAELDAIKLGSEK